MGSHFPYPALRGLLQYPLVLEELRFDGPDLVLVDEPLLLQLVFQLLYLTILLCPQHLVVQVQR